MKTGAYKIEGVQAGVFQAIAYKGQELFPYLSKDAKPITLAEGQALDDLDLLGYPGSIVRGAVREKGTGKPIPGVEITPANSGIAFQNSALTGPDGTYELKHMTFAAGRGSCMLFAYKAGYTTASPPQGYECDAIVEIKPGAESAVCDIELAPALHLTGRILLPNGAPAEGVLAGADVERSSPSPKVDSYGPTKTDSKGEFNFDITPNTPPESLCNVAQQAGMRVQRCDPGWRRIHQRGGFAPGALCSGLWNCYRPRWKGR